MADYTKITQLLDAKLAAITGLPSVVQYENTTIALPNTGLALEVNILPSESVYNDIGIDAKPVESGIYQVTVISKLNIGRAASLAFAQKLRDYFTRGLYLTKDLVTVRILKTVIHPASVTDINYKIPVSVYYLSYS